MKMMKHFQCTAKVQRQIEHAASLEDESPVAPEELQVEVIEPKQYFQPACPSGWCGTSLKEVLHL